MAHVNHFLPEIDKVNRRRFKESIIAVRVAGATEDSYNKYMNHLRQTERQLESARKQVYRGHRGPMTPAEQQALDAQEHVHFNDLAPHEQEKLKGELKTMWDQIPAHIIEKSKKLAGH